MNNINNSTNQVTLSKRNIQLRDSLLSLIKFNVEVTILSYSEKNQAYETFKHKLFNIKGRDIVSDCFYKYREINSSDIIRIDATTVYNWIVKYNISAVFVRNDLES